ncbi:MAG: hypothetical protein HFF18_11145 [Oscillospiraceae bacterium]|nr:hypothetical protein [Oscillospiraceae bacterium]
MQSILNDLYDGGEQFIASLSESSNSYRQASEAFDCLEAELSARLSGPEQKLLSELTDAYQAMMFSMMRDATLCGLRTGAKLAAELLF